MCYNAVRHVPIVFIFEVVNMPIKFSDADVQNIIKLRSVQGIAIAKIGEVFGVGYKPIARVLSSNGITIKSSIIKNFTDSEKKSICKAYDFGIGANGIPEYLGLSCSCAPVIRYLRSVYGTLRNQSQQQQARMDKSTPEEIAALTRRAHEASKGRKATFEERHKRAKTIEGHFNKLSPYEPTIFGILSKNFESVIPAKAIDVYNADFAIGSVAVEVFGGGWSIADKTRIARYLKRTKKLGELGYHTVFIVLPNADAIGNASQLIAAVNEARSFPAAPGQYRVVWGNRDGASGFSSDINNDAFVCPFVNVRDRATGRYYSIPKEA